MTGLGTSYTYTHRHGHRHGCAHAMLATLATLFRSDGKAAKEVEPVVEDAPQRAETSHAATAAVEEAAVLAMKVCHTSSSYILLLL